MLSNFANNIKTTAQSYKPFFKSYASIYKIELASLLFKENIIRGFFLEKTGYKTYIYILFKYDIEINIFNALSFIPNVNKASKKLLKNNNGLGFCIISTKIGLMPLYKAKKLKIGGYKLIKIN